jgi:hypothetical protein
MANQTVDELDPTLNIKDTDLIEVTVDDGGGAFTSYKMEFGEFKKFLGGYVPEKIAFLAGGTQTYTPAQYEAVLFAVVFDGATIEITKTLGGEVLLPSTDATFAQVGYVATSGTANVRRITITSDIACIIQLITIKNLYS